MKYCFLLFVFVALNGYSQNFSAVQKDPVKTLTLDVTPSSVISSGIANQVIVCSETSVMLIDITTGKKLQTIQLKKEDFNVSEESESGVIEFCRSWVSSDAKYFLVSTMKKFKLYAMGDWTRPLMEMTQSTHGAAFSPDNSKFYTYERLYKEIEDTSSEEGYVYTWDIASKKMLKKTPVELPLDDLTSGYLNITTIQGEDMLHFALIDYLDSRYFRNLVSVNLASGSARTLYAPLEIGAAGSTPTAYHECVTGGMLFSALTGDNTSGLCQATDIISGKKAGFVQLNQYPGYQYFINCQASPNGKYVFLKYQANDNPEGQKGFIAVYSVEKLDGTNGGLLMLPYKVFPGSDSDSDYSCMMPDNQTLVVVSKWNGKELTVWKL